MILSGVSLLLGFLASNMDSVLGRSLLGSEMERYEGISFVLITTGSLLLAMGFIGFLMRYGQQTGRTGKIVLIGGALFGFISLIAAWPMVSFENVWSWTLWYSSFTIMFLCLALFGLLSLRNKFLPRWNALPLIAGIGIPIFVSGALITEALLPRSDWFDNMGLGLVILLVTSMGVGLLGFILQGDTKQTEVPA